MKINQAARLQQLDSYFFVQANQKIKQVQQQGKQVINLGIGQADLQPPKEIVTELHRQIDNPENNRYPGYVGLEVLKQAISQWHNQTYSIQLDPELEIFPMSGAKEAIIMLTLALTDENDLVLYPNPGYDSYQRAAQIAKSRSVFYDLTADRQYVPDLNQLDELVAQHKHPQSTKLLWINYPHNPTGATITKSNLQKLVAWAHQNQVIIASDQPYGQITFDGYKAPSILEIDQAKQVAIEINSLSKTYNIPGWRIGWIAGNQQIVAATQKIYGNTQSGIYLALQKTAITALQTPPAWIEQRNTAFSNRRDVVLRLVEALGLEAKMPKASMYVWAKLPDTQLSSETYCFELLERTGVFLAPGTAFGSNGQGYVRISLTQPKEKIELSIKKITNSQNI